MRIKSIEEFQLEAKQSEVERNEKIDETVLAIIQEVRKNGDNALLNYAEKFDGVRLENLVVTEDEFEEAEKQVSEEFLKAIEVAQKNIKEFHAAQLEKSWFIHKADGVMLGQQVTPMDRVGVYIPGGKAAYPSTVLMNLIPAHLAGVPDIYIATPPQADGKINPHVLVAAKSVGVNCIFKMGGAQAVAAFAYGTETVKKVDKIVGPGNDYVARAKKWVYGDVAIDMIAGPSEICIVADETARADYVAADLLSQAEHDEAATSICITTNKELAQEVATEVNRQLAKLERREVATASIENNGQLIVVDSLQQAFTLVNDIAPEHLQLMIENATDHLADVKHAGAIFLGNYSPEPLGDYMAGPNHTLPTSGTAKFASPLGVYDFMKKSSIIRYSETALLKEASYIETLANMEGLSAHAKSIEIRRKKK
ncbi:histidinol dehydrogenase [Pseudogracilibacillus auburnensis]|uniref:Histidinol dehydrogenase n=1 Tax=Pseudogracilibacillus auburnensis TaxID=1494959 RepID=A0A2V3VW99_9BACI|nr:histidinol dehydrogenase [Pseudogracilibacillus auburnensis]MBO1002349.1 histidinol dehydrogenase [Pseudogracilibacillus auburnensis]PXW86263.1 histidinol dehydrogenase [Pseudogracilibacillus auburnensis]